MEGVRGSRYSAPSSTTDADGDISMEVDGSSCTSEVADTSVDMSTSADTVDVGHSDTVHIV